MLSTTKILLVDDEKELLELAKTYIEEFFQHSKVYTCSSVNEALELINKISFDAIISDYQMPNTTGLDFLTLLRNSGNKTLFIMFTGRGSEEVAIKTLNLGGDYYLQKGADPKNQLLELINFIEKAIAKKQTDELLVREQKAFKIISEATLKESENYFRLIAEKASDSIWTMNLDFEFTYVSPFVEQYLGYTPEEMIKQKIQDLLTPKAFEFAIHSFEDEMRIEKLDDRDLTRTRTIEMEIKCKDGSYTWGETNFSFLRNPEGVVVGILGVTRDITRRKQMEQKMKKQQQQILKQRNELDLFAGIITHDLRGKLQRISLYNEMNEHKNKMAITKQIEEIAIFINNLFLYARKGEFIGDESKIDLNDLIERIVSINYSLALNQEVIIKKLPIIKGDKIRFAQLFDNLIRNIVKHAEATKVEIYPEEDKEEYRIIIKDNGKGISKEEQEKIIKTLTTKEYSSFGLLIVSKTIQAYSGDIVIECEEGKGTTIIVSIPKRSKKKE